MRSRCWVAAALVILAVPAACSSSAGDDPVAFCDALTEASIGADPLQGGPIRQVDLEDRASIDDAITTFDELATLAPTDIADDMSMVSTVYIEVLEALDTAAPGTRDDVLRELQPRLDEVAEPARRLERYASATCALEFEAPAAPTPTPTPLDIDD